MPHRRNTLSGQGRHRRAWTDLQQQDLNESFRDILCMVAGHRWRLFWQPLRRAGLPIVPKGSGTWTAERGLLAYYNQDTFFLIMGQYQDR